MVGKSDLPSKPASAPSTSGHFGSLDLEREASMADEGGAAGAQMERQPDDSTTGRAQSPEDWGGRARIYPFPRKWRARLNARRTRVSQPESADRIRPDTLWLWAIGAGVLLLGAWKLRARKSGSPTLPKERATASRARQNLPPIAG